MVFFPNAEEELEGGGKAKLILASKNEVFHLIPSLL